MIFHSFSTNVVYSEPEESNDRCSLIFIQGSKNSFLFDSGNSTNHIQEFLRFIQKKPDYVVLSHYHWDHVCGLCAIEDCESYASEETISLIQAYQGFHFTNDTLDSLVVPFIADAMREEYVDVSQILFTTPKHSITQKTIFNLGDCHVEVFPIENPHSSDSLVAYIPEKQLLLLGDSIYEELDENGEWVDHKDKVKLLVETLTLIPFTHAIASHQPILTRKELIEELTQRI